MNAFPIYRELREGDPVEVQMSGKVVTSKSARDLTPFGILSKRESMERVGRKSMALCGCVYAFAGLFGYFCAPSPPPLGALCHHHPDRIPF